MPLNKSSTHGWMMTANTCAPAKAKDRRHLETEVKGIMNIESAEYSASEAPWQTTSSTAFRGFDNKTMLNAKLPTTMDPNQPNQTFPDEEEEFQRQTRYQSSHKTQFLDFSVGKGRHVMIKKRTNDPSEADHPTLGRHDDPGRLEKQAAMGPPVTTSANAYANPGRESYQPLRCAPRRLRTARVCARARMCHSRVSPPCAQEDRSLQAHLDRVERVVEDVGPAHRVEEQLPPSSGRVRAGQEYEASPLGISVWLSGEQCHGHSGTRHARCGTWPESRVWGSWRLA